MVSSQRNAYRRTIKRLPVSQPVSDALECFAHFQELAWKFSKLDVAIVAVTANSANLADFLACDATLCTPNSLLVRRRISPMTMQRHH
jgi:hypothetical protein